MDVDLILEAIFGEYKTKAIKAGKDRKVVEDHLELVREQVEASLRDATDDFIGRPINDATRAAMRDVINQQLNQFLDTEITLDSITDDRDSINIEMTYRPRDSSSGVLVQGSVTATSVNPAHDIISHSL
jgi:hypothetical protein